MIQLTRLNNQALIVNCDLIKFVETAPDTVLTLVSGEKILVRETPEEVLERILAFRHDVIAGGKLKNVEMKAAPGPERQAFSDRSSVDIGSRERGPRGSENG